MKKDLLCCIIALGLAVLLHMPATAEAAAQITLQNSTSVKLKVALLVPGKNGWLVAHWWDLQPWSRRSLTMKSATPGKFGYYAVAPGYTAVWGGETEALVSDKSSWHLHYKNPGGPNVRTVGFRMKQGDAVNFSLTEPLQKASK